MKKFFNGKRCIIYIICFLLSLLLVSCSQSDIDESEAEVSVIDLSKTNITLYEGQKYQVFATVLPNDAEDRELIWRSSSPTVATVSDGLITAKSAGITVITAKSSNGKSASLKLEVKSLDKIKKLYTSEQNLSLAVGDTYLLGVFARPTTDSSEFPVVWSSSDGMIASVSQNGRIVARGEGGCFIYAEIAGVVRAVCKVDVNGVSADLSAIADVTVRNLPVSIENSDFVFDEESQAFENKVVLRADLTSYTVGRELTEDGVTTTLTVKGIKTYDYLGEDSLKSIVAKMKLFKEKDVHCDDFILVSEECAVGQEFTLKFMFNAEIELYQRQFYVIFES